MEREEGFAGNQNIGRREKWLGPVALFGLTDKSDLVF